MLVQDAILRCRPLRCCPSNHHVKDRKDQEYKTYSIILPLSLVRRLVGELDHPDPGAKLKELDPPKRLGEQICKLVLGVDVARLEVPLVRDRRLALMSSLVRRPAVESLGGRAVEDVDSRHHHLSP
jgi:hypothetical protein